MINCSKFDHCLKWYRRIVQKWNLKNLMSIDEQIIPSKTRRSGIHQHNPKKLLKWKFKMFVRAVASGMMYVFLYSSKGSIGAENCSWEGSVMQLVKHLPQHKHHTLCFDNWFTTIPLMIKLKALGITALGTIWSNRLQNCPLETDKDFKKSECGSSSYRYLLIIFTP